MNSVFDSFYGEPSENRRVMQVNTYGGHPGAARGGPGNNEILQEEKLAGRAAEIGAYFLDALQSLKSHKNVGDIRGKGLLIGVELVKDRSSKEQLAPAPIGGGVVFWR